MVACKMEVPSAKSRFAVEGRRLGALLFAPLSRRVEMALWLLVVAFAVGIRLYLLHLMPVGFWSEDARSYANSAFDWLHTGVWETDPRRGAIYSLFIALVVKGFGTVHAIVVVQHLLGLCAVLFGLWCLRLQAGRAAALPAVLCGYAYAVYGMPLLMEHTVRNETLLFFFASCALCSWFLCLRHRRARWLWVSGVSVALLSLTKNVFFPFPFVVLGGALLFWRGDRRFALRQIVCFFLAFAVPTVGIKVFVSLTRKRPAAPQSGVLLYGRTAQFTVLEGGKYPEIKAIIRKNVEDYRALPKLNNNLVLKRTIVPQITAYLEARGKDTRDLNRVCRELALEGIAAHPWAYFRQMAADFRQIHLKVAKSTPRIRPSSVEKVSKTLREMDHADPLIGVPGYLVALKPSEAEGHFELYNSLIRTSWLFRFGAVFFTSCLLPFFFLRAAFLADRLWWAGLAAVWFFTVVLLCTIGRPMDRYMIPVVPILFLTLSTAVVALWNFCRCHFERANGATAPAEGTQPLKFS